MKKLSLLGILCAMLFAFSCSKEGDDDQSTLKSVNLGDVDHFTFGLYHGHCRGNCATAYKLKADGLFADKVDQGYLEPNDEFEDKSLSQAKIELAAKLLEQLPSALFKEEGDTFGCPDCADQGGFYVEIQIGKAMPRVWRIDTNDSQIPDYLSAYTAKIRKTMEELEK